MLVLMSISNPSDNKNNATSTDVHVHLSTFACLDQLNMDQLSMDLVKINTKSETNINLEIPQFSIKIDTSQLDKLRQTLQIRHKVGSK